MRYSLLGPLAYRRWFASLTYVRRQISLILSGSLAYSGDDAGGGGGERGEEIVFASPSTSYC